MWLSKGIAIILLNVAVSLITTPLFGVNIPLSIIVGSVIALFVMWLWDKTRVKPLPKPKRKIKNDWNIDFD